MLLLRCFQWTRATSTPLEFTFSKCSTSMYFTGARAGPKIGGSAPLDFGVKAVGVTGTFVYFHTTLTLLSLAIYVALISHSHRDNFLPWNLNKEITPNQSGRLEQWDKPLRRSPSTSVKPCGPHTARRRLLTTTSYFNIGLPIQTELQHGALCSRTLE